MMKKTLVAGLALAALALGSTAASADVEGNCGALPRMNYAVVDSDKFATDSRDFVPIPKATVHFTQFGTTTGCVVVRISAETLAPYARYMIVRPILHSSTIAPLLAQPSEAWLSGDYTPDASSVARGARSFEFVFPSVKPGPHVIVMQMRSYNGRTVVIRRTTITVQHR
jgi:hypothetical protein